ncbi:hypothetical protein [Ureaplasma parvum]|nr:hypothetical protein [Ureaplasma parvum]
MFGSTNSILETTALSSFVVGVDSAIFKSLFLTLSTLTSTSFSVNLDTL